MNKKLRVLIVEDSENDALFIIREFRRNGYELISERVDTEETMRSALDRGAWDVILSDYAMPQFNGVHALKLKNEKGLDVPFVLVSGKIGEETAVEMMRAGAHDYIMKDNLTRLVPAVERELKEARIRMKRVRAEEKLKETEKNYRSIFNAVNDAIFVHDKDSGYLLDVNKKMTEMFGYTRREACRLKVEDICSGEPPYTQKEAGVRITAALVEPQHFEWRCKDKAGRKFWVDVTLKNVALRGEKRIVAVVRDISERKLMEDELRKAATTDILTGLLNRRGFFGLAQQQIKIANRTKKRIQLVYMDIDKFKDINDKFGHQAGDQVLVDAANILKITFRESDIISRIGGDEFAVLLMEPLDDDIGHAAINRMNNYLRIHNEQEGLRYDLLFSVGISYNNPDQQCTIDDLLSRADQSMYEDKKFHKLNKHQPRLRKKERLERRAQVRYRTGDNFFAKIDGAEAGILDIGRGGVGLKISKPLRVNSIAEMEIAFHNKRKTALSGVVVWSSLHKGEPEKDNKPTHYETGMRFIKLRSSDRAFIRAIISDL